MDLTDSIAQRLKHGGRKAILAFASACGERAAPVYETYWDGDFTPAVRRAIEVGWDAALGKDISAEEAQRLLQELRTFVGYYHDEGITMLASSVTVALRVLECVLSDDLDTVALAAARAHGSTLHVAALADTFIDMGKGRTSDSTAHEEEGRWQSEAINRVERGMDSITRTAFSDIGPIRWWTDYENAPHHI